VESEKTAVICSALMPEYVWFATGGKSHYWAALENPDFLQIAPYISPEYQGVLALLMDDLGLVPVDIKHLSQN